MHQHDDYVFSCRRQNILEYWVNWSGDLDYGYYSSCSTPQPSGEYKDNQKYLSQMYKALEDGFQNIAVLVQQV